MKKNKKISFVIVFLLLDVLLCASLYFIMDATNINLLKKEINNISKLDMSIDRFNKKNKTIFKYKVVENTIKDFLDDYSKKMDSVYKLVSDKEFTKILSYDNYVEDGPTFEKSIKYIIDSKIKFNNIINDMESDLEKKNIKKLIRNETDDKYYISLYEELVFSEDLTNQYENNRELLKEVRSNYNEVYDTSLEVLNFLVTYKDSWSLENGEIKFINNDLYNYYNSLIDKIKKNKNMN